jgi:hypothetical protein
VPRIAPLAGWGSTCPVFIVAVDGVYFATRHPAVKLRAFVEFLAGKIVPIPPWDQLKSV